MRCNFHVGQKVVFVNDKDVANRSHLANMLVVGKIYTVDTIVDFGPDHGVGLCVDGSNRAWQHWRFRPIIPRRTDISVFKAMLETPKVRVPA